MKKFIIFIILAGVVGWFGHSYYYLHVQDRSGDVNQIREDSSEYKFINPLLFVGDPRNLPSAQYNSLQNSIQKYISGAVKDGKAENVSFYLRDLNNGGWVGVNENNLYSPGSLLKVSVMIAYFKLADENEPNLLSTPVYYSPTDDPGQNYKPKHRLAPGYYPVQTLINQMITESDNDALHVLNDLRIQQVLKIYKDLRLPDPLEGPAELISPREYSRLFRVLYNVGYISNKYSEKALSILSETTFDDGLVSGVASTSVTVSHKFGEFTDVAEGVVTERELHDCGNVYYPGKPYFICVMTKGKNFQDLSKIISDISKITFDSIRTSKPQ